MTSQRKYAVHVARATQARAKSTVETRQANMRVVPPSSARFVRAQRDGEVIVETGTTSL
jgi:hypothetical protein